MAAPASNDSRKSTNEKRHGQQRHHACRSFRPYTLPEASTQLSSPSKCQSTSLKDETQQPESPQFLAPVTDQALPPITGGAHHGKRYVPSPQELERFITPLISAFPKEQHGSFLCVFRKCEAPLLRTDEIFTLCKHLCTHVAAGDSVLKNALDQPPGACSIAVLIKMLEGQSPNTMVGFSPGDANASSQKTSTQAQPTYYGEEMGDEVNEDGAGLTLDGEAVEEDEDEVFTTLTQPKMRQSTLRKQMLYYGLPLFRIDSKQRYVCFFRGCKQRMANNFSRHILRHEKLNHPVDSKLEHLCARRGTPGYQPGAGSVLVAVHQTPVPRTVSPERGRSVIKSEDRTPSPSPSPPSRKQTSPKKHTTQHHPQQLQPQPQHQPLPQYQSGLQLESLEALTEAALLRLNQRSI